MTYKRKPRREAKEAGKEANLEKQRNRLKKEITFIFEPTDYQLQAQAALKECDLLLFNGPPGSGKSLVCTWLAVQELLEERVKKIYIVRPAVEAGEKLGALPGPMLEKLHPYLMPIFLFIKSFGLNPQTLMKSGCLEVVPISFIQGRTLDSGVVIFDEAQNCTKKQLRLVLGRLGCNSKMLITGDPNQVEILERPNAYHVLCNKLKMEETRDITNDGFKMFFLNETDIMRHYMVPKLLRWMEE